MTGFTFFSYYDSHSMNIDLYMQTGKNWHEGRSTDSDDWNCHAVHSIGCIWHMQNYSISLHSKLLMPIMLLLKCQSKIILLHPTITMKFSQVLGALTLPVGKLVVDYVLKNHEASLSSHVPFSENIVV
jgi:hypothetical protein